MNTKTNDATILLRLPSDLKERLMRAAAANGRRITSEVNTRLRDSFEEVPGTYGAPALVTAHSTAHTTNQGNQTVNIAQEISPVDPLTETDRAMLAIFRRMPVEKQLALLSLFK